MEFVFTAISTVQRRTIDVSIKIQINFYIPVTEIIVAAKTWCMVSLACSMDSADENTEGFAITGPENLSSH
jgi:hypothetical protein